MHARHFYLMPWVSQFVGVGAFCCFFLLAGSAACWGTCWLCGVGWSAAAEGRWLRADFQRVFPVARARLCLSDQVFLMPRVQRLRNGRRSHHGCKRFCARSGPDKFAKRLLCEWDSAYPEACHGKAGDQGRLGNDQCAKKEVRFPTSSCVGEQSNVHWLEPHAPSGLRGVLGAAHRRP